MRLLIDTHVLLWWLADDAALTREMRELITDEGTDIYVSAASGWEISIKRTAGKLNSPGDLAQQIEGSGFHHVDVSIAHACAAGALPQHHGDPFDRMLVAQAMLEGLTIATRDRRISLYGVATLPA